MQSFQFHPVIWKWFEQKFGSPTEPQERGWPAIQSGGHTLIAAPTGSGKTLAAFFAELDLLFRAGLDGKLKDETRVVYVSPLKALSNDIHKNLAEPLAGIRAALLASEGRDVDVRAAVRTGDTTAAKRQAIVRKPPHILVTTPESLYLLLTSASGRKLLATVRTLIVDEIHAVVGNRRGSHLALSMERLSALVSGPLQRIGLSATQNPIELVAEFLVGSRHFPGPLPQPYSFSLTESSPSPQPSPPGRGSTVWPSLGESRFNGCQPLAASISLSPGERAGVRADFNSNYTTTAQGAGKSPCVIIDACSKRQLDIAIELPGSPLEAVMSNEVWSEVYNKLASLIEAHRTTLVFVNTRRLAERLTQHLSERLGKDKVTSHHGSLAARLRLEAEDRLKRGELKALVATASLELGIDIGSVDLVCQVGPTRSIATLLQRVGRAEHRRGGLPKGRIFPLSRDELVECVAALRSVNLGELDRVEIPQKPIDVLAQQIVACAACEDWEEDELFRLMRSAWPYRNLARGEFDEVLRMLADGFSTKRGRRGALIHHDGINHRLRGRRGARLVALTSGGAIADNADYRVVLEPSETFIGTVNEDFAIESMAGDIFQLGNASWKILRVNSGQVRVEDARGQPPSIPFWLGEAPGRTAELSRSVSALREQIEQNLGLGASPTRAVVDFLTGQTRLSEAGAQQLADYFAAAHKALGVIPSQRKIVMERFFDESGGMQLVIHSPFGNRVNRAWGLALRKRFCRSFNFELQAAATDDAIVLSLGTQHSFPLEEVFRYLHSKTVRDLLIQALLDAPMFPVRWRWNAARALALPRQRGGRKIPAPLQRMESENLLAAVFPDQLACLENIAGDREVPNHPLVRQTIEDCLGEAMDIDGLIALLERIEKGEVECIARDLPEPSPMAHEILNARPYAFLDNAPLEERRTQAVLKRRAGESSASDGLGILDVAAIERVCAEAWPRAINGDELHEALLLAGLMTESEVGRVMEDAHENGEHQPSAPGAPASLPASRAYMNHAGKDAGAPGGHPWLDRLVEEKRAGRLTSPLQAWVAAERLPLVRAVYPQAQIEPHLVAPEAESSKLWEREDAIRELLRGRMEIVGPVTANGLAQFLLLPLKEIEAALLALEAEGFVLRGKFHPGASEVEWCDRRLLARIHRLTINQLRAEIQPVSIAEFQRFLAAWQRVDSERRAEGPEGLEAVLELLDGYELPAAAWEPEVLALRVKDYSPQYLDQLCFTGRIGWGRLNPPQNQQGRLSVPVKSSPVALFNRANLPDWLLLSTEPARAEFSPDTRSVFDALHQGGALFFGELVTRTGLLPSRVEQGLAELAGQGLVTSDSFEGLRALLVPQEKRRPFADLDRKRHFKPLTSVESGGRWSLLGGFDRSKGAEEVRDRKSETRGQRSESDQNHVALAAKNLAENERDRANETFARTLLRRYGVVFRRLLDRESLRLSWYELGRIYRRWEARGEIRGGYFVNGVSGEQFALPEAIGSLRSIRKTAAKGELIAISAADPLNLAGILTPGPRVTAIASNRILLRDGVPIAAMEAGKVTASNGEPSETERAIKLALQVGTMPVSLRPYYA